MLHVVYALVRILCGLLDVLSTGTEASRIGTYAYIIIMGYPGVLRATALLWLYLDLTIQQLPEGSHANYWKSRISPEILEKYLGQNTTVGYSSQHYEGDIDGIDPEATNSREKTFANFINKDENVWPDGIVPYFVSPIFNSKERVRIRRALRMMSDSTSQCVTFVERTDQEDYIKFVRGMKCISYIGKQGKEQIIQYLPECVREYGDIQHEVMHALGFYHEMSRSDRDAYITINYDNVAVGDTANFNNSEGNTFGLPYDYTSIMHYPFNAFAKNPNLPTIIPKASGGQPQCMGQRHGLSALDIIKIKIAYKCMDQADVATMDWKKYMETHPVCATPVLKQNEELEFNTSVVSPSGEYILVFQPDNNVVLYRKCDNAVIFATDTFGLASFPVQVILDKEGQLKVRDAESGRNLWTAWSGGKGKDKAYPASKLYLSDSGYLYLCSNKAGCYWRSIGYHVRSCNGNPDFFPSESYQHKVIVSAGQNVKENRAYYSPDRRFYVRFAASKFFLRRKCDHRLGFQVPTLTEPNESGPVAGPILRLTLGYDGKLAMYDEDGDPVWSTTAAGDQYRNAQLRLYDDGFLYLCSDAGCYWQSSGFLDNYWKSYISPEILDKYIGRDSNSLGFSDKLFEGDIAGIDKDGGLSDSFIGRDAYGPQPQPIELAPACVVEIGDVQHEVMHALGFFHEMSRSDRDDYVTINFQNVQENSKSNFEFKSGNTFKLPYDYSSVMHYPITAFAKNTSIPTIIPKKKCRGKQCSAQCIAQRKNLSPLDAIKIKIAYGCMKQSEFDATNWLQHMQDNPMCSQAVLKSGYQMNPGGNFYSPSSSFRLSFQSDRNLVLYRQCDEAVAFATDTYTVPNVTAILYDDGHFVVKNAKGDSLWSTETWGYGDSQLLLSDSGYFYLCNQAVGCYWRSVSFHNPNCNETSDYHPAEIYPYQVVLKAGEDLDLDSESYSPNGRFRLEVYKAKQLVVWRECDYRQSFKASTARNIARVAMQSDGNLVIYDQDKKSMWSSRTWRGNYIDPELRLYDNGFLYLCDYNGCYWQSSGFLDTCSLKRRQMSNI
ncbi:uncharacterized protein LOC129593683 [Paramacrobiotus metropolitanus]|uniref:uncharacterized protein LOC129593683 n=1 Tax=Paramacrobiotus metropolitanus TaxID=2943436 RepID=UPI002445A306|nr:uncharacterized protein LOC129593683 [Paramacrobiotus metropolitanus]